MHVSELKQILDKVRSIILTEAGTVNPKIVGTAGIQLLRWQVYTVPEDTNILIGEVYIR